jgi:hypothetical protein
MRSEKEMKTVCPKPLRNLFEEASEEAEKIFGDDTKL